MENLIDEILFNRLKKTFDGRVAFFVGAGISVPSGVPDFKELNEEVIRTLSHNELQEDDYRLLSQNIRPEVMYQIAMDELGPEVLYSLELLEGYEPNYYHYFLAEAIRRGNWVFTTNPDNLIEVACEKRGMKLGVGFERYYGRDSDEDFKEYLNSLNSGNLPPGRIFKLHGSIEDGEGEEKYRTVRFALRQVGKGLFGARREVLAYFLKNLDLWFIGYSCRDDFSVFPVLSATRSNSDIFWFLYDGGPLSMSILEEPRLRWEIEREESKPLDEERDLGLININEVLLQRRKKYKFVGDLGIFMKAKLCPQFGIEIGWPSGKARKESETFSRWAIERERFERCVFLGRLFEEARNWDRGIQFYNSALDEAKTNSRRVRAKTRLADLYYRESIPGKENEAINLYEQCIDSSENSLEKASLKVSISNVQRRRGKDYYSESFNNADKAKGEFESILGKEDSMNNLDYARCLNVYGLILYSLGRFEEARKFFIDSIEIKEALGDVDGMAESENALSLTFTQEGRKLIGQVEEETGKSKFLEAIAHARMALALRRKIGNYRGYAQNCRNLAWPYSELMKLASEEHQRQEYFAEARNGYKGGISSWNRFRPPPPTEIVLFSNLLAGLYIDFCYKTQDQEQKKKWAQQIIPIYEVILRDPMRKDIARSDKRTPTADQNLARVGVLFKELDLYLEEREADRMLKELRSA